MMVKLNRIWFAGAMLIALALLAACGPQPRAAVSEEYARGLAERKMQAINTQDYALFIEDFSEVLENAFTEAEFQKFSGTVLSASGAFESITGSRISAAQTRGYVSYIYSCKHANENLTLTMVFAEDGEKVEGIFFNAARLNEAIRAQQ
jgi:hypothetical protein